MPHTIYAFIDRTESGYYVIYTDDGRTVSVRIDDFPGFADGEAVVLTFDNDLVTAISHDTKRTLQTKENCRTLFLRLIEKKDRSKKNK